MTSEGLGEMSMGGRAEGLACADPGARNPIGASGNFVFPSSTIKYTIDHKNGSDKSLLLK